MLRVTLDLLPQGDHRNPKRLGTIEIANIDVESAPDKPVADYAVTARGNVHADATLRQHPRMPHWRIVLSAIRAVMGDER